MNKEEYLKVRNMEYIDYVNYLKFKHGEAKYNYFSSTMKSKNSRVSRTKEGLYCHHIMEDEYIDLSDPYFAKDAPPECQNKENLVYCDLLEHLLLHVFIRKHPKALGVSVTGIEIITSELNDLYSGWTTTQAWRQNCHNLVKDDKEVYLMILKQYFSIEKEFDKKMAINVVCTSFNEKYGLWSSKKNQKLYKEIKKL